MDHGVDLFHSVTGVTAFVEVGKLLLVSTTGGRQFVWPHEVVGFLEGWADGEQFVDDVLDAGKSLGAKGFLDDAVVGQSYALLVNLSVTTFVYELTDGLQVGVTIGNVWFYQAQHVDGCFVAADKHTVVDLSQAKQLQDLAGLWCNTNDTTNADNGN